MASALTTAPRSRRPWGLAGMLALVLAAESFVGRAEPAFSALAIDMWADARDRAASDDVRSSAVLCFGDSQVQQGILATAVGERLGVRAYNLAIPAGQPAAADALLRRALDAGARPSAIVVGFFPAMLARDMRINGRTLPEALGPAEALDLAITGRDTRLAATTLLGRLVPSVKAREEIRVNVAAAIRGEDDRARTEVGERRRVRRLARGSFPLPSNPHFADEPIPAVAATQAGAAWRPDPANERYLRRFLRRAADRGIAVYWLTSPLSPSERVARERSGLIAGFDDFLGRLRADFPNLAVLDAQSMAFDRTAFGDYYHLDGRAAAVLSRSVADVLGAGLPPSRRVALTGESPRIAAGQDRTRPGAH